MQSFYAASKIPCLPLPVNGSRKRLEKYGTTTRRRTAGKFKEQTRKQREMERSPTAKAKIAKRTWTAPEDAELRSLVLRHGTTSWTVVGEGMEGRSGKQCRERYYNHLAPDLNKGEWSEEEDQVLVSTQLKIGNQWAVLTKYLPGRTDNAIKNRFHALCRAQSRQAPPAPAPALVGQGQVGPVRRHPLVPALAFPPAMLSASAAAAPALKRPAGNAADDLSQQLLDLQLHCHDHSHEHVLPSDSDRSRSSYNGASSSARLWSMFPSPRDTTEGSPRLDGVLISSRSMDDAFVSTILPTFLVGVDDDGDAQQQQGSLRDLFAMTLSPQRAQQGQRLGQSLESALLSFSASASALALGSVDDALLLLGSLDEDELLGPSGDLLYGGGGNDETEQSILSVLLDTYRGNYDDDSSGSSGSSSSISSSSDINGNNGGGLVKSASTTVHDTPRSPRCKRSRFSPRA